MRTRLTAVLRRLGGNRLVRFLIVGGVSVVTNTGVLYLLHGRLGTNLTLATVIAFGASFVVNFLLNRFWTFESDGSLPGHLWRYAALVLVNLGLNAALETGLTWAGIHYLVAQGLTTGALSMLNYVVSRRWIFTADRPAGRSEQVRLSRLWGLAFAGFLLTFAAWGLASPAEAEPDEFAHTARAYAVVDGQVYLTPDAPPGNASALHTLAASVAQLRSSCWQLRVDASAACHADPAPDRTPVPLANTAGRYNPVYYALVGWPLKIWPTMKGLLAARLLSAALSAALLAGAFVSIVRFSTHRLMLGALLLGTTPMLAALAGSINPNGVEIAGAIAMFAAGLPLLQGPAQTDPPRWLLAVFAAGAVALVTVRSGGPLWLAIAALALLPLRWRRLRTILGGRAQRWTLVVIVVAGLAAVLWTIVAKADQLSGPGREHLPQRSPGQLLMMEQDKVVDHLTQAVGVFGWLNIPLPGTVYLAWLLPAAALVLLALTVGGGGQRLRVAIAVLGPITAGVWLDIVSANEIGFATQGRYILPLLAGALLLAAWTIEHQHGLTPRRARSVTRAFVILTTAIQLGALVIVMTRFQNGIPPEPAVRNFNPLAGSWHPAVGSPTCLLLAAAGLGTLAVLVWRLSATAPALQTAPVAAGPPPPPAAFQTRRPAEPLACPADTH